MQIKGGFGRPFCFLVVEPSPDRLRRAARRKAGRTRRSITTKKSREGGRGGRRRAKFAIVNLRVALVCCNSSKGVVEALEQRARNPMRFPGGHPGQEGLPATSRLRWLALEKPSFHLSAAILHHFGYRVADELAHLWLL
jgi:hypothetical protein